ncbi:AAA domain-containing protein, partial [Acidaminobacter sp.]|uniref:AAA domain-containing protein n=1 Tax=Acidaminobacter sp. TaxID=1872102 RepID=UPI00255FBBC0
MNTNSNMLLHKGRDISADVKFCTYNPKTKKYDVTFLNGKEFSYNYSSLLRLRDPKALNPANIRIEYNGCELNDICSIQVFSEPSIEFWRIRFIDGRVGSYNRTDLKVTTSCLSQKEALDCLKYLRQLSQINELRLDNGEYLLKKLYDNLEFIGDDTGLAVYLNYKNMRPMASKSPFLIFPFGGNASQFEAVSNALNNQISVIQGPPGTGKTQTILNIIANLLVRGKTIQIVSNNNSATNNIFEKLSAQKYGMDFLVAQLGNSENKSDFLKNQTGHYPDLQSWVSDSETLNKLCSRISLVTNELKDIYTKQERQAKLRQERKELELEIKYFRQYCDETGYPFEDNKNRHSIKSERLMHLWHECYDFSEKGKTISFWFKIKSILYYKISDWNFYKNSLPTMIT